ncbi:hypothetical protein LOTGIDRAFT_135769 [Lottia gigantea]|uniref:Neurotransmitter-gated ion-channel ligand-binding domain-containing protein n=1 Tax=Lottia gigantea TaxID=225164 RepID=V4BFS2_LOTGI|nr:hypothetical protein LOTGIDRAFT_135769 [Lottia gigantea]ESP04727.1 hypothetical protein LOTGIDRAFT_135769 [Lottia gigantea]
MWSATFVLLFSCYGLMSVNCVSWETTKSLKEHLLGNYSKDIRPIRNQSDPVIVKCNIQLTDIVDLDEVHQILSVIMIFTLRWKDEFLGWNSDKFEGLSYIQMDQEKIWTPRINLHSNLDDADLFGDVRYRLTARQNGQMTWTLSKKISVTCLMDVVLFPLDTQRCALAFTPLLYSTEEVKLVNVEQSVNTSDLKPHGEWVFGNSFYINWDYKLDEFNMSVLYMTMEFKRLPLFFLQNFLVPIIIISFLNLLTFWLPDGSGEKASFSITVLLALTFYLTSVSSYLPQNSNEPILITLFISFLLTLSCLTVLVSLILINRHHKHQDIPQSTENNHNVSMKENKKHGGKLDKLWGILRCRNSERRKCGFTIDVLLFLIFFIMWISLTAWFFVRLFRLL